MTNTADDRSFIPDGWHTITPRIVARDARGLVEFVVRVFAATGEFQQARPTVLWIGDSAIMISEDGLRSPSPAFLYVYMRDTDLIYRRAVDAGAHIIEEPLDTPYGDRRCMFEDAWGNTWQVATPAENRNAN